MNIPIWEIFQGIYTLFQVEPAIAITRIVLILAGALCVYLGYKGILEGLVMIPMGLAMVAVNAGTMFIQAGQIGNLFVDPLITDNNTLMNFLQIDFLQPVFNFTFSNGLIPCMVFMGIGAITDIDFMMAKPFLSMALAVAAEFGTIFTFPLAIAWDMTPAQAASISIVGGADGPMVLFTSLTLAKELFVPIAVIAYMYLALAYVGFPYIIRFLIPKRIQGTPMDLNSIPKISRTEKLLFTVLATAILCLLFPVAAPLIASFFMGVAIKEGNVPKLQEFLSGPLLYGSTFFLGFVLGALLTADTILNGQVWKLIVLGCVALLLSALGGLAGGMIAYKLSKGKVNPLIGIAAVSCVPTTAKIAQKCAYKANKKAMILPFAMGPGVAGVITTAIIAGIFMTSIPVISDFLLGG
ncbi:MAG: sodium ion-translocating decarboxylase subunit beta [Dehalococcoidales bacterium]|nr:sodium ion-translocating decarboxylase subunit beta [Dehalococcoidales bacterium]